MNDKITYNWRYTTLAVLFSLFGLAIIAQMVRIQLTVNTSETGLEECAGRVVECLERAGVL